MRFLISILIICFFSLPDGFSQVQITKTEKFIATEKILMVLGDSITKGSTELARAGAVAEFNSRFLDLLSDPETFNYPFDSLKTVSKVKSADGNVRIYTWIHPMRMEKSYKYYGLIHRINPVSKVTKLIGLQELKISNEDAEISELRTDSWYGAIYFDIVEVKIKKKKHYVLLGWHGNDLYTNRKLIDVLTFDQWDNITFGKAFFSEDNKKVKTRVIFEHTSTATMMLRYDKKKKMIVFDHLSPSSPSAKGQYRYYGPDFTYDGYRFKKGMWNYKSNLDLRNPGD